MIDPKLLRTDPDLVRRSQEARGDSVELVDELVSADEARRSGIATHDRLRAEQKELGRLIPKAQGDEKTELLARTKQLAADVKAAQEQSEAAGERFNELIMQLGNIVIDGVPRGGEDDGLVIETVGVPRDFAAEGFEPKDHLELGEALGAIDMERGTKISGSRFYVLTGIGARLEFALLNLAMTKAVEWGFTAMIPPALVKPEAMAGTGFLGQAAKDVYHLPTDDLYLVGTSEVALAAFHSDEILDADSLPRRYAAFSPCFRREAGSYGKDTRGIFRVHWFDKVEMFIHCLPEAAQDHAQPARDHEQHHRRDDPHDLHELGDGRDVVSRWPGGDLVLGVVLRNVAPFTGFPCWRFRRGGRAARDRFRDAFENGGFVGAGRAGGSDWTGGGCCAATGSGESGRGRDALRRSPRDWERRLQG